MVVSQCTSFDSFYFCAIFVGMFVGSIVGSDVGSIVGSILRSNVGSFVGSMVGWHQLSDLYWDQFCNWAIHYTLEKLFWYDSKW